MFQVGSKEPGRRNNHPEARKSSGLRSYNKVSCSLPPCHAVLIALLGPPLPQCSLPCCQCDLFKTQIHRAIPLLANKTRSNWLYCLQDEILISWQTGPWASITPPDVPYTAAELHHRSTRPGQLLHAGSSVHFHLWRANSSSAPSLKPPSIAQAERVCYPLSNLSITVFFPLTRTHHILSYFFCAYANLFITLQVCNGRLRSFLVFVTPPSRDLRMQEFNKRVK